MLVRKFNLLESVIRAVQLHEYVGLVDNVACDYVLQQRRFARTWRAIDGHDVIRGERIAHLLPLRRRLPPSTSDHVDRHLLHKGKRILRRPPSKRHIVIAQAIAEKIQALISFALLGTEDVKATVGNSPKSSKEIADNRMVSVVLPFPPARESESHVNRLANRF